jgi:uncharacterized protein
MAGIRSVILDTGPLVAYLDEDEQHHGWACEQFGQIGGALVTCESVLSEAFFVIQTLPRHRGVLRQMIREEIFDLSFSLANESSAVTGLMEQYRDLPMSLADACLVRMSELWPDAPVFTLDSDFRVYRRNKRQQIPVIAPRYA